MNLYEAAVKVKTDGLQAIRPRKIQIAGEATAYDVKDYFGGSKRGWTLLDAFTASAIRLVYEALEPANKEKFLRKSMMGTVNIVWKLVKAETPHFVRPL